jgi:hypothetical protein
MAIELLGALGAGSGLDTKAIVDALVEAKRAPQAQQITQRIETSEATVSAYGQVSAALEGVRSAFNNLNDVDDLTALTIRNSSTAVAVEAGAGAQGGSMRSAFRAWPRLRREAPAPSRTPRRPSMAVRTWISRLPSGQGAHAVRR